MPAVDDKIRVRTTSEPASGADPITPSDTIDLFPPPRALRFDVGGVVKLDFIGRAGTKHSGQVRNVQDGEILPYGCITRVYATTTTASTIDALY